MNKFRKRLVAFLKTVLRGNYQKVANRLKKAFFALAHAVQRFWIRFPGQVRIGITGSAGKSTTQRLLTAIVSKKGRTEDGSINPVIYIALRSFVVGPWFKYWVQEIGTKMPGTIKNALKFFHPQIGVVTVVRPDHISDFPDFQAIIDEKARLVEALPPSGTAVLNADDPAVLSFAERTPAKNILTYGLSEKALVRGANPRGDWPETFSLDVTYREETVHIETQLHGGFWGMVVLAAVGGGLAAGFSLQECAAAIKTVTPLEGRSSIEKFPDEITFLLDENKLIHWMIPTIIETTQAARAARKILVWGRILYIDGDPVEVYRQTARAALKAADKVIFVGEYAYEVIQAMPEFDDNSLLAFETLYAADQYLQSIYQPGDLVIVKGSSLYDHQARLILSRRGDIKCWRQYCTRDRDCYKCNLRLTEFIPGAGVQEERNFAQERFSPETS